MRKFTTSSRSAPAALADDAYLIIAALPQFEHLNRRRVSASERLAAEPRLWRIFDRLHRCGSRATAHAVAELVDAAGVDGAWLDELYAWERLDPATVAAVDGDRWPRPPLDLVPDDLGDEP